MPSGGGYHRGARTTVIPRLDPTGLLKHGAYENPSIGAAILQPGAVWYQISEQNRVIPLETEREMAARMGAKKIIIAGRQPCLIAFATACDGRADRGNGRIDRLKNLRFRSVVQKKP